VSDPKASPQAGASSTPAQIVLAGGAGVDFDSECAKIKAQFNPPIVSGTHSDLKEVRPPGYERQHIVPTSNLHVEGRSGPRIPGCDGYSTGTGWCYLVFDNQREGTEHKLITDTEKNFAQKLEGDEKHGTLKEWLDMEEKNMAKTLPTDDKELAQKAAKCLRMEAEKHFAEQGVSPDTPLRNGQALGEPPPQPPTNSAELGGDK
jgi:hypothetical protein